MMKNEKLHSIPYAVGEGTLEDVYALRLLVLRPGGTLDDCRFAGDEDEGTSHFTVADMWGKILAIGSFYEKAHPELQRNKPIQLRGMATHPDARNRGYGSTLVQHALQIYKAYQYDLVWCNAREAAVPFYERLGFAKHGEAFEIESIGTHYVMYHQL